MTCEATNILCRFESLVQKGKIAGFTVSIQQIGLMVRSEDGSEEQLVVLDQDTFSSVEAYFDGINTIQNSSYDYISLKSLINAKTILERMLNNKEPGE